MGENQPVRRFIGSKPLLTGGVTQRMTSITRPVFEFHLFLRIFPSGEDAPIEHLLGIRINSPFGCIKESIQGKMIASNDARHSYYRHGSGTRYSVAWSPPACFFGNRVMSVLIVSTQLAPLLFRWTHVSMAWSALRGRRSGCSITSYRLARYDHLPDESGWYRIVPLHCKEIIFP